MQKLDDGFKKCVLHIEQLIECSKILHKEKKFTVSIALSVLANEELAKLYLIYSRIRNNKPIKKEEWNSLVKGGSHTQKLIKLIEDVKTDVKQMGKQHHKKVQKFSEKLGDSMPPYEKIITDRPTTKNRLNNMNMIKKDCFYFDWKKDEWFTVSTTLQTSKQEALSEVILGQNSLVLLDAVLGYKYPTVTLDENSPNFKAYKNDSIRTEQKKILQVVESQEFQKKIQMVHSILDKYSSDTS